MMIILKVFQDNIPRDKKDIVTFKVEKEFLKSQLEEQGYVLIEKSEENNPKPISQEDILRGIIMNYTDKGHKEEGFTDELREETINEINEIIDHLPQEKEVVEGKILYKWGQGPVTGATEEWARIEIEKKVSEPTKEVPDIPSVEELIEVIDNITEGRLKDLTVYQPSFTGTSKKSMLHHLAQEISALYRKDTLSKSSVEDIEKVIRGIACEENEVRHPTDLMLQSVIAKVAQAIHNLITKGDL